MSAPSRRIAFAIGISLLLHGLLLWGPNIELPHSKPSLPPLAAKLEALPGAPATPKPKRKARLAPKPEPIAQPIAQPVVEPIAEPVVEQMTQPALAEDVSPAASAVAASAPPAAETITQPESASAVERPALPHRAQLTFDVYNGTSDFKIGEVTHTLEIDGGHYVLHSATSTVGLASLIKTFNLTQYSSGSYARQGLQPEQFFEERAERLSTQRNTVEFDHAAQRARFSRSGEAVLPPDTQDILSILYQFPPLANTGTVAIFVSNSRKIERYEFDITANENIRTAMGELRTVHLRKMHQPDEEGLEIWLAQEYRLLPVKLRIIDRNGEISGESVITGIRAEFEEETKQDVDH